MMEIFKQIFIVFFIITQKGTTNPLLNYITNDSIFSAIDFIQINYQTNLSTSTQINLLVRSSIVNRYLYYFLLSLFLYLLKIMLWWHFEYHIYILASLTTCPYFIDKILEHKYFLSISNKINREIEKLLTFITCKQLSKGINFVSMDILNHDPKIDSKELEPIFEDFNETKNYIWIILKMFLISSFIRYVEDNSSFYAFLVKFIYYYNKEEIEILYTSEKDHKKIISGIIMDRKWNLFLKQQYLESLLNLYHNRKTKSPVFKQKINNFKYLMLKMFACWTLSAFFEYPWIISILSFYFLDKKYDPIEFCIRFLVFGLSFFSEEYLLLSLICEFGIYLYKILSFIKKYMSKHARKYLKIITKIDKINISCLMIPIMLKAMFLITDKNIMMILNGILFIFGNLVNYEKRIFVILSIFLGLLSSYNIWHMYFISFLFYETMNIIKYKDTISIQNINVNRIAEFYIKPLEPENDVVIVD